MKKEEFDIINKLEETHWWYVGTREICMDILQRFIKTDTKLKILDIGCGTGGNMKYLMNFGDVEGVDIDPYAIDYAKAKGLNCEIGTMENQGKQVNNYDLITLFDVFNQTQVNNQKTVLRGFKDLLRNNGLLAMREPAMNIASGKHDKDVNIVMRFNKNYMKSILEDSGFKVLYIGYMNSLLFFPILLKRKIDLLINDSPKSDVKEHSNMLNTILLKVLRIEKWILRRTTLPFGISLFVIAQKE